MSRNLGGEFGARLVSPNFFNCRTSLKQGECRSLGGGCVEINPVISSSRAAEFFLGWLRVGQVLKGLRRTSALSFFFGVRSMPNVVSSGGANETTSIFGLSIHRRRFRIFHFVERFCLEGFSIRKLRNAGWVGHAFRSFSRFSSLSADSVVGFRVGEIHFLKRGVHSSVPASFRAGICEEVNNDPTRETSRGNFNNL